MNNITEDMVKDTNDYELIMLYREEDEDAKNILFFKYKFIIDILINKYKKQINKLKVDYQELYSECNVGFSDGLRSFQDAKSTSLPTFLTICVERRINNLLRKYKTDKYKVLQDTFSLDNEYDDYNLLDVISDDEYEPLKNMTEIEDYQELIKSIKSNLTDSEYDLLLLKLRKLSYDDISKILKKTPKQIDNTMQRIKAKIKKIVQEKSIV